MEYLMQRDARLGSIINQINLPTLPAPLTPYHSLLQAVISQQVARPVAQRLWQRLLERLAGILDPEHLLEKSEQLQALGLSSRKIAYLQAVSRFAQQNDLSFDGLMSLSDQQIIQQLTAIEGIGRWTVQMLLSFSLQRSDVFISEDLIIRRAMQQLYGLDACLGRRGSTQLQQIAANWAPYRSTACRYLWQWASLSKSSRRKPLPLAV